MVKTLAVAVMVAVAIGVHQEAASAHCDAMDGPLIRAARTALERNDIVLVLRWVSPGDEAAVRAAFARTIAVRSLGDAAKELADTWFFETLVRIHRAGEGAPFDGLKPAGHIEPFVAAVDRSLEDGSVGTVVADVEAHVTENVRKRFAHARDARARADESVEAGRAYVAAYVDYLHYVEALHKVGGTAAAAHQEVGHPHQDRQ